MDTAAAAAQANVTPATIRAWCRRGIIAAAKTGRRWVIDTASLLHRIAGRKTTRMTDPTTAALSTATYTMCGHTTSYEPISAPTHSTVNNQCPSCVTAVKDAASTAHSLRVADHLNARRAAKAERSRANAARVRPTDECDCASGALSGVCTCC